MKFERVRKLAFRTIAQIGISYPTSSMSQALPGLPNDAPAAGDRFPWMRLKFAANDTAEDLFKRLDDRKFNLLVIGQSPTAPQTLDDFGDLLRIHTAADPANTAELARAKVPQRSLYLLRPDGHVGLCGTSFDAATIKRYLTEQVHLKARGPETDRFVIQDKAAAIDPRKSASHLRLAS
jgi:aromatic ring hydroxylase-like protein